MILPKMVPGAVSVISVMAALLISFCAYTMAAFPYTIVKDDTLWKIAERYKVNLKALIAANPQIQNPNKIWPGQKIVVPDPGEPAPGPVGGWPAGTGNELGRGPAGPSIQFPNSYPSPHYGGGGASQQTPGAGAPNYGGGLPSAGAPQYGGGFAQQAPSPGAPQYGGDFPQQVPSPGAPHYGGGAPAPAPGPKAPSDGGGAPAPAPGPKAPSYGGGAPAPAPGPRAPSYGGGGPPSPGTPSYGAGPSQPILPSSGGPAPATCPPCSCAAPYSVGGGYGKG